MRGGLIGSLGLALSVFVARPAAADPEPETGSAVALVFGGGEWDSELADEVRSDLAAELEPDGIALVGDPTTPNLLAAVEIELVEGSLARIEIRIADAVTDKVVVREVDLEQTPSEARSLELAIATEELLQASWAELQLLPREDRPPPEPPPPEVERSLEDRTPPPPPPETVEAPPRRVDHRVGGKALGLGALEGMVWLGAVGTYELRPVDRLGIGLGLGGVGLVPINRDEGRVTGGAGIGELHLSAGAVRRERFELGLIGGVRGFVAPLRGESGDGTERRELGLLGELRFGARAGVRAGPVWLEIGAEVGHAPGQLRIRAGGDQVVGYGGLDVGGAFGVVIPLAESSGTS